MTITNKSYTQKLIDSGFRTDQRKFDEYRKITLETNVIKTAEGSSRVRIGNTHVIVGVKLSVMDPFPDAPDEGIIMVGAEFDPVASPDFESGPPSEDSIELARIIDRGIRESKAVGLEKLCITPGKKVWCLSIDIQVLDHDGNLIDASALGAIAALMTSKIPKYDVEKDKIDYEIREGDVPINEKPIEITIGKISNQLLVDLTKEEEDALDARLTIATTSNGDLCAMQKGGNGYFTIPEIEQAVEIAIQKGKEIRKLVEKL